MSQVSALPTFPLARNRNGSPPMGFNVATASPSIVQSAPIPMPSAGGAPNTTSPIPVSKTRPVWEQISSAISDVAIPAIRATLSRGPTGQPSAAAPPMPSTGKPSITMSPEMSHFMYANLLQAYGGNAAQAQQHFTEAAQKWGMGEYHGQPTSVPGAPVGSRPMVASPVVSVPGDRSFDAPMPGGTTFSGTTDHPLMETHLPTPAQDAKWNEYSARQDQFEAGRQGRADAYKAKRAQEPDQVRARQIAANAQADIEAERQAKLNASGGGGTPAERLQAQKDAAAAGRQQTTSNQIDQRGNIASAAADKANAVRMQELNRKMEEARFTNEDKQAFQKSMQDAKASDHEVDMALGLIKSQQAAQNPITTEQAADWIKRTRDQFGKKPANPASASGAAPAGGAGQAGQAKGKPTRAVAQQYITKYGPKGLDQAKADGYDVSGYAD
jgi:hypothetical protein